MSQFHIDFRSLLNDPHGPAENVTYAVTDTVTKTVTATDSIRAIVRRSKGYEAPEWIRDSSNTRSARWAEISVHGADFPEGIPASLSFADGGGRVWSVRDYMELGSPDASGIYARIKLACISGQKVSA